MSGMPVMRAPCSHRCSHVALGNLRGDADRDMPLTELVAVDSLSVGEPACSEQARPRPL